MTDPTVETIPTDEPNPDEPEQGMGDVEPTGIADPEEG